MSDTLDDPCPGAGKCHGCLDWCADCGVVRHVCDARIMGERCDAHPVPTEWPVLRAERRAAEARIAKAQAEEGEARRELERIEEREAKRRGYDKEQAKEDARIWNQH